MYKALDIRTDTEVVILDPKWLRVINQLRELDRQDFLVCQGCRQPVRVRAGIHRREHFAHKHLENCDYADESTILRNARAVLYEWLTSKFGEKVVIEKKVEGVFRPIDCWVEQDSKVFAYWIFDSTLKPDKRNMLHQIAQRTGLHFNWVFASEISRTEQDEPDNLVLSTTEREFIQKSSYDLLVAKRYSQGSLHYLDSENRKLTTYRGLSLYHEPQIYKGMRLVSELDRVKISPKNGEFVHDGEYERLQQFRQRQEVLPKLKTYRWDSYISEKYPDFEIPQQDNISDNYRQIEIPKEKVPVPYFQNSAASETYDLAQSKSGVCILCGQVTDDWWWYDGKTGECRCRACQKQGKF